MAKPRPSPSNDGRKLIATAIAAACLGLTGGASADAPAGAYVSLDEAPSRAQSLGEQRLFLEIFHGDRPIGLIAELRLRDQSMWATPRELGEIGLAVPADLATDEEGLVPLDALPGLSWRYDAAAQRLHLIIPPSLRPEQALGYKAPTAVKAERSSGWRLGYDAYGQHRDNVDTLALGTSLAWFGRMGTLELDGVSHLADAPEGGTGRGFERLDTRWTYSDPERMWSWTVGDLVNGGLAWSRPVRMGGGQWRRNFSTRPDLVTMPLPRFSADATLPSAVELYVDNVRQFGSTVQDGPFVLDAIPSISGAGMAQLVVRDALGRETTTTIPLYFDNERLATGLTDFSVELGLLRRGYAGREDDYGDDAAASASWRRGMTDTLTLEAHAEATRGLALAGAGIVWAPDNRWGLINASVARNSGDEDGWQQSVGYQYNTRYWGLDLQSQRRSAGFRDLGDASVLTGELPTSLREEDRATFWVPTVAGDFSASWIRFEDRFGNRNEVRSLSWNRQFQAGFFLTASVFDDGGRRGGGINLTIPLSGNRQASLSVQESELAGTETIAAFRQDIPYEGGWGWGVQASDRANGQGQGRAYAGYRNDHVEAAGGIEHNPLSDSLFAQTSGSIVGLGGQVFFARRIYDAFALVSTGVGGVPVLYENRLYGHTDADGHLLLPDLRGWQRNRIAIDPDELPANYRIGEIERFATPTDRGGVLVEFDVRGQAPAIAVLLGRDGKPLAAGQRAKRDDGNPLIVGFDGEAYFESLDQATVLETPVDDGVCRYALPAVTSNPDGTPVRLRPAPCEWTLR